MRLGLIGCGAIGGEVVRAAQQGGLGSVQLAAVLVRRPRGAPDPLITHEPDAFFDRGLEVVVECAGHQAVQDHGVRCLESGADLMLTSIGALVDDDLRERLEQAAAGAGRRLTIASAGIGALDILGAAAVGGLTRVRMTVRKDPSAWWGTEAERLCDLASLEKPLVIYQGTVREGAARYPQNVNISAAVALAGLGLDRTELTIVADPTIRSHVIEIVAEGTFGSFRFCEDVLPTMENPKTGRLVAMAVIKTIRQLAAPVVIGG
jgi:aspartate dehydrogenase